MVKLVMGIVNLDSNEYNGIQYYTSYCIWLLITFIVLLAMIGTIVLTIKH